jgi:hypothetical protein
MPAVGNICPLLSNNYIAMLLKWLNYKMYTFDVDHHPVAVGSGDRNG